MLHLLGLFWAPLCTLRPCVVSPPAHIVAKLPVMLPAKQEQHVLAICICLYATNNWLNNIILTILIDVLCPYSLQFVFFLSSICRYVQKRNDCYDECEMYLKDWCSAKLRLITMEVVECGRGKRNTLWANEPKRGIAVWFGVPPEQTRYCEQCVNR